MAGTKYWKNQACIVEGRAFFCVCIPKLSILEGFFSGGIRQYYSGKEN